MGFISTIIKALSTTPKPPPPPRLISSAVILKALTTSAKTICNDPTSPFPTSAKIGAQWRQTNNYSDGSVIKNAKVLPPVSVTLKIDDPDNSGAAKLTSGFIVSDSAGFGFGTDILTALVPTTGKDTIISVDATFDGIPTSVSVTIKAS